MNRPKQTNSNTFGIFPKRKLFDSHCHLDSIDGYLKPQIEAAIAAGVEMIVGVSTDIASCNTNLVIQQQYEGVVLAGAGLHPELVIPCSDIYDQAIDSINAQDLVKKFQDLLLHNNFQLIGECGLDYYWLNRDPRITPAQKEQSIYLQKYLLQEQLKLAKLLNLPVSLHSRESTADCLELCRQYAPGQVVFHSFTGTLEEAKEVLERGYRIGINGIITYKSATDLRDTIKTLIGKNPVREPGDLYKAGFYLETDAPLLFPSNSRTREPQNSPKQIPYIWEYIYKYLNKI